MSSIPSFPVKEKGLIAPEFTLSHFWVTLDGSAKQKAYTVFLTWQVSFELYLFIVTCTMLDEEQKTFSRISKCSLLESRWAPPGYMSGASALNQKKQGWKTVDIVSYSITIVCNKPSCFFCRLCLTWNSCWFLPQFLSYSCNYIYQYMK